MKKLVAIGVAFMLLIGLSGCPIPGAQEAMGKIGEAVEKMEEIQTQLDDMQDQLDEITDSFNTLADEFDKHMENYHKKKTVTPKPTPREKKPPRQK